MRQIPRIYRQNIRPIPMDREAHIDAFRGLKDVDPDLTLGRYCYERGLGSDVEGWMQFQMVVVNGSKAF